MLYDLSLIAILIAVLGLIDAMCAAPSTDR